MPDILRDGRKRGWFHIDNALLDRFGAEIGAYGVAVYAVLARHADAKGVCFPSYQRIADKLGVSRRQAIRTVAVLVERGLVRVQRRHTAGGRPQNVYVLTDDWCSNGTGAGTSPTPSVSPALADGAEDAPVPEEHPDGDAPAPELVTEVRTKETQGTRPKKQTQRGGDTPTREATSLPDDFTVSDALYAYAEARGVGREAADAMTERFVLHWQTTPKDARKTDWDKAWQAWLLGDLASGKIAPRAATGANGRQGRPEGGNTDGNHQPDEGEHGPFAFAVRGRGNRARGKVDPED